MELVGRQTCFVHQRRVSSAVPQGSLSWRQSCYRIIRGDIFPPGWALASKLLLPRICDRVLSRTPKDIIPNAKLGGDCRGWKWICQHQEQRLARTGVKATAAISAGRRNFTSGRRQSTSRRPEGSGGFNVDLELEILAFMLQAGKSDAFPSKEELLTAGRWDLVEAIVSEGGWLASGWEKKANASVFGGVMPETAHGPLSRKRATGSKSKAVRSARRSRGRPKLLGRRSLSITASPGENSEPDEPQKDVISGQTEDQKIASPPENTEPGEPLKDVISGQMEDPNIDSPRVEKDSGAAVLEPSEKDSAASPSFERVRKERGSRFPSNSAGYRLWEFESLADFIEYRKLDAKNRSGQRRESGLCSTASGRRKSFEPEAAKRRSQLCERRCEAPSELRRQGSRCYEETDVKKDLATASPLEQDTRVDEALNVEPELDNVLTVHQYPRVDEAVNSEPDVRDAIIREHVAMVDGAVSSGAELDTASSREGVDGKQYPTVDDAVNSEADVRDATAIEHSTRVDGAMIFEAELDTASSGEGVDSKQYPRVDEAMYSEAEMRNATIIEQDTRVGGAVSPEVELDTRSLGEEVDSKRGKDIEHIQAFVIAPEADVPSVAEQDSSAQEASSSFDSIVVSSTGGPKMIGPIVETEGKVKKTRRKKKKRKNVSIEETEDVSKTPEKMSEALDWINQIVDRRERWMQEAKSKSLEASSEEPKSIQDRIRSLEDRLAAARTGLLSGKEALGQKGDAQEQPDSPTDEHIQRLAALRDASDELEYTENKILKISNELTTTRREVAALEGAHGIDIMDIRNAAGENERKTEIARTGSQTLRTARIVWPHPAREVLLIGSFDGWKEKIKMELSGAGVFVVSLPLPPGRYEIKFIVDGTWRVDTGRTIIYVGGYENNVLVIPEQFILDQRR